MHLASGGQLLQCNLFHDASLTEVMETLHHLTALAGPHHRCTRRMAAVRLSRNDHRVYDLVGRVVHRQHLEPSQVCRRIHHRVQESPGSVRASRHQDGARGHVVREVLDHPDLVVVADPHQRRQEHHVVAPQRVGHAEDVRRVELHASGHVGVPTHQETSPSIGRGVQVVVMELRFLHVSRGQHEGAQRQRAGANERHPGRRRARHVPLQEGVLQLAELEIIGVVREEVEVVKRVVITSQHIRVVALHEAFGLSTELDELAPHVLHLFA